MNLEDAMFSFRFDNPIRCRHTQPDAIFVFLIIALVQAATRQCRHVD